VEAYLGALGETRSEPSPLSPETVRRVFRAAVEEIIGPGMEAVNESAAIDRVWAALSGSEQ
jgi:hypothetical protein